MSIRGLVVIILTLLLSPWEATAGDLPELRLDVLADVESQAHTLLKDRDGFVWIGTYVDGVYRYDGKRLKHYAVASGMIRSNSVPAIIEDRRGAIWFAASGGGLTCFDKETNQVTAYVHHPEKPGGLSSNALYWAAKHALLEDRDGDIWLATNGGGLNRLASGTAAFVHYRHDPSNPATLSTDHTRSVFQDSAGMIWVGTEQGLCRLDKQTGAVRRFRHDPDQGDSLSGDVVMVVFEDRQGNLWVGTEASGLNRFDRSSGTFARYRCEPRNPASIASDRITDIFEDDRERLWICHETKLTLLDLKTGAFCRYDGDNADFTRMHRDQDTGQIWALTDSGRFGLINSRQRRFLHYRHEPGNPNSLPSEIVVTIYEDRRGDLWIACLGGLARYDVAKEQFTRFLHRPGDARTIPSPINYAPGLLEDSSGNFWVGAAMPATLSLFDRDAGQIVQTFRHEPGNVSSLPDTEQINRIREDRHDPNILWISSTRGLIKFDKGAGRFTTYGQDDSWDVLEDRTGTLYLATWGNGLARFDRSNGSFTYFRHDPNDPASISDNTLVPLFEARNGAIWVGTENGLNRFDPQTGRFARYTHKEGYPWEAVHSIGEDTRGHLWLGTSNGLARFDPASGQFRRYGRADGIQGSMFYALNGIMSRDGRMWFGGTKGMNSFFPDRINDNPRLPAVRLSSIRQGGVEVDFGKAPERLGHVTLEWKQNFFEFEFSSLEYTNPEQNQYAYKLEGLDADWYFSGSRNFGRYAGLAPGEYVLRLRGTNNDGVWNTAGQQLGVTVLPPFWKTRWFYGLMAFAAVAMLAAVIFYLIRLNGEIAERRKVEGQLIRSNAQLEDLNRELQRLDQIKDAFLANTSHELRTPLTGIIGLAESLIDGVSGPLPAATVANLAMIVASGRRLATLVDDILDFSRLRHHDLVLTRRPLDLSMVARVVMTLMRPLAEGKGLMLENRVDPAFPPVDADENRLQQILFNLVGNAIKFTQDGGVTLTARTIGAMAEVSVSDTGIGIAEDCRERIFLPFEQVDGTVARQYGGTGLGLAVTRHLVELHGGAITMESAPQQGACFRFTLPLADPAQERGSAPAQTALARVLDRGGAAAQDTALPEATSSETADGPRILVVDDEPVNLQVLSNHLELQHYRVTRVASGPEALAAIDCHAAAGDLFDLVLLDVMMPKMSGYEVCQRLREKYPPDSLPVVMLTAKNQVEDLVAGLDAGANDYLTKPFAKAELLARIRHHAALKSLADQRRQNEAALAASERKYRELFEAMPDVIFRTDPQGRLLMASPALNRILGYRSEELIGQSIVDKLLMDPTQKDVIEALLRKSGRIEGFEAALRHKDGPAVWVSTNAHLYHDENGGVLGVEGIFRDITRETKLETQLLQAQKMEAMGTLAGGIAHDFNNILSAIIGYTEIALCDMAPGPTRENLGKVLLAGNRARDLVQQILTFSRQSAVEPKPVRVRPITAEAIKLLRASLPAGIEIQTDFRSEATVLADPTQLHQVIMNLGTNAAHAMRQTGGILHFGLEDATGPQGVEPTPGNEGWLKLTVRDTGAGIPGDIIERIFDPFFTTKGLGEGTGMGLAVVHGIVTHCGGRICVDSQAGSGTTFTLYFPALAGATAAAVPGEESLPVGTERILLVDDEPFQLDLGKQMLERLGYRILTEADSIIALDRFRKGPTAFDLVITDMNMPKMNGDRLAAELLAIRPELPVILCTGYSEDISDERAATMGIRGFAMKPVIMKDIAKMVRAVLDGHKP